MSIKRLILGLLLRVHCGLSCIGCLKLNKPLWGNKTLYKMLIQWQIHEIKGSVSTLENVTPPPNFPYTVGRELQNKYTYQ